MKHNFKLTKHLLKTNLLYFFILVVVNTVFINFFNLESNVFYFINSFVIISLFIFYRMNIVSLIRQWWLDIKKETMYYNYPLNILFVFLIFVLILVTNIVIIDRVNKEALNAIFVFSFFTKSVVLFLPSILMFVYMVLIVPAFTVPSYEINRRKKNDFLVYLLLILILFVLGINTIVNVVDSYSSLYKNKYAAVKLPVQYSSKYLKYKDFTENNEAKLKRDKVQTPFLYTSSGFTFRKYSDAEEFCNSIGAKVPNHLEMYNILFHQFNLFGEKYYWTSDKAGRNNVVLHYKDMSYEVMKSPSDIKPVVYCMADLPPEEKIVYQRYFYKTEPVETETATVNSNVKYFDAEEITADIDEYASNETDGYNSETWDEFSYDGFKSEMEKRYYSETEIKKNVSKYVKFNVMHVTGQYMEELLSQGYVYDLMETVNPYYEESSKTFGNGYSGNSTTDRRSKEINLCYFPFTNYTDMSLQDEMFIWQQSFCSPEFEVINETPELKSRYEKNSYCNLNGGRLPNIPELTAILKTFGLNYVGVKFWTNNEILNIGTGVKEPVAISYADDKIMNAEVVHNPNERAYSFCIKKSDRKHRIIANFKSKFAGENGKSYATKICPDCLYYEMPDVILKKY